MESFSPVRSFSGTRTSILRSLTFNHSLWRPTLMIRLENLTLLRSGKTLLDKVNLYIEPGQRVGFLGANGCGKSSLLALIRGEIHEDGGTCEIQQGFRFASVAQETPALDVSAVEFAQDGDTQLRRLQQELADAESREDWETLAHLHGALEEAGVYTAQSRAASLLHGLGFSDVELDKPVRAFSGGWRMRLNLAQALFCPSDVMLLDEPTNHLDLEAIIWLEQWLSQYRGILIVISHDRDFLDGITTHIVHFDQKKLKTYRGNYSSFELQRAAALSQQQAMYAQQQRDVAHLEDFVRRFKAKASKARQAQSRMKALEKMELIAPAHVDTPFDFHFRDAPDATNPMVEIEHLSLGYGDKTVIRPMEWRLAPGQRIGLLGPNGMGKSTFIRFLAGETTSIEGKKAEVGEKVRIGYFAQQQLEQLDLKASPFLHIQRLSSKEREQNILNFLGGFDFRGDMVHETIRNFSGGEKARLVLAMLVWQQPNLLLLDEPTNHLDLEMRQALTTALQDFQGALVLVSHDRHLMNTTVDEYWIVADGEIALFDGDLLDYQQWLVKRAREKANALSVKKQAAAQGKEEKKSPKTQDAHTRQQIAQLKKDLAKLDGKIAKCQQRLAKLEEQLADSALYADTAKADLQKLLAQQTADKQEAHILEEAWFVLHEQLESIEG